jgi:uncharacterized protein (TIGR03083 family)
MEISQHIAALDRDGTLLANAAVSAGLDAGVPPCPGWRVRDLVRHTGYIHRWAASHITQRSETIIDGPAEGEILASGPADGELIAWFRDGHAALVRTLGAAAPDVRCATFLRAPSPLAFWARRQAHETAIHRFDAQSAARMTHSPGAFAAPFAADGIDELIVGFASRSRSRLPDAAGRSLSLRASDTGDGWHIAWQPDGSAATRRNAPTDPTGPTGAAAAGTPAAGAPSADCVITGPASGLYLFLWNRCDAAAAHVVISGNPDVVAAWNSGFRVRWS